MLYVNDSNATNADSAAQALACFSDIFWILGGKPKTGGLASLAGFFPRICKAYASFGAGGGLGLPVIGKLLGHTQASTMQRYAHLDADPLRRASETIGGRIAAALERKAYWIAEVEPWCRLRR